MRRIGGAAVAAALAGLVWVARAEDRAALAAGQAGQSNAPTIRVYSRETLVDVTVADDTGQPVLGLTKDDFTVTEDGKAQAIRGFEEFDRVAPVVGGAAAAPKLPPNVHSNRWVGPAAGPLNVFLLGNIGWSECVYATKAIAGYVSSMPAGTQVALFVEERLVQGFTSDSEVVMAAMNADPALKTCVLPQKPEIQLIAMRAVAAYVAGDKGKKNLIWFTHGIPGITDPQFAGDMPDPTPELHHTYRLLAAAQTTVYPVDASSVVVAVAGSLASEPLLPNINRNTGAADATAKMGALGAVGANHLSLEAVAEGTGGEAFYNTNDLKGAMTKAIDDGSSYYTLSYVPPGETYDGKHHTIHVKVDRPGLHLVYRDDYYAEDPAEIKREPVPGTLAATTPEPEKNSMKASMGRFAPVATQVRFDVKVAPTESAPGPTDAKVMGFPVAEFKGKAMERYDILYTVPANEIAFSDGQDGAYRGSLEFDVVASDVFGKLVTSVSRTMPLVLSVDEYAEFVKTPFQFAQQIDLPAGDVFVRVGVLDWVSKKVGTVEVAVKVAKAGGVVAGR